MRFLLSLLVALTLAPWATASAQADAPAAPAEPTETPSLAEPPEWPLGFMLPDELIGKRPATKEPPKADILVWVPDGAKRIRAMLLIPNNSDSKIFGEHAALRQVAARREMGIVYMRNYNTGIEHTSEPDTSRMPKLLSIVADTTGIIEFLHAPWVTFGKSSRGEFPFRMAWLYPDRTIASVSYHGETPTWPVPGWANLKDQTILEVNANGQTEWGGTWFNHVRPSLLNYRAGKGWLAHLVVAKDVGHGDYPDGHGGAGWGKPFPGKVTCIRVWDYLSLFIDKAIELRLPQEEYPTAAPVELKQVDEAAGCLIDPFAVEELFRVPHLPLRQGPEGYLYGGAEESPVSGYAALAPPKDFTPPEGVPVVRYESAKSPREWLLTDSLKFAMQADPMLELGELRTLMPKPGDEVTIDGRTLAFRPIIPKEVGRNGGIALNTGLRPPNAKITLLAYTVLEVADRNCVRVRAGYTAATRIQMVINGVPVRHKQVLELEPGRYPMLVVLRMTANWDRIEPGLENVSEADVALARNVQAEADKQAAEQARLKAAGAPSRILVHKAADVPKADRAKMFWVADQELADAWVKLHAVSEPKAGQPAP